MMESVAIEDLDTTTIQIDSETYTAIVLNRFSIAGTKNTYVTVYVIDEDYAGEDGRAIRLPEHELWPRCACGNPFDLCHPGA